MAKLYRDMTVREWFALTGEHRLAFDRALSVQVPRKKSKPQHPQRWRGGDLYNYGDVPPRYPMPATFGQVFITSRNVYRANPQGWDSETYL